MSSTSPLTCLMSDYAIAAGRLVHSAILLLDLHSIMNKPIHCQLEMGTCDLNTYRCRHSKSSQTTLMRMLQSFSHADNHRVPFSSLN